MIQRSLACGLLALLALTACGPDYSGDPTVVGPATPASGSTNSANASTTASPSATQSAASPTATSADQLDEETRQQLLAAPVAYYEAIERAYATLDYSDVERLSSEECGGCQAQLAYLKRAAQSEYRHERGTYTVAEERVAGRLSDGRWAVELTLTSSGVTIRDSSDKLIEETKGRSGRQQINLAKVMDRWVVSEILGLE